MKKRRPIFLCFLVAAGLALSVGYATLNDTLTINGTAGVDLDDTKEVFDGDIYFSKAVASAERCTAVIDSTDPDTATMTVVDGALKEVGDEVIATFTVKSESDLNVNIAAPAITNGNPTYFAVETTWDDTETLLLAGQTKDIVVTVRLIKTAAADQDVTFGISLVGTSVADPGAGA